MTASDDHRASDDDRASDDRRASDDDRRLRLFADGLPVLCWMADGAGSLVWFNRRWHDYCGSTPAAMAGDGWQSVHHPDSLPHVLERWAHCLATGQPTEIIFPIRGRDGRFRTFLTRVEPTRDGDGAICGWSGVSTDIAELTEAQTLLARNAEAFTNLVVANPFGIYVVDADFRLVEVSRGARAVFAGIDPLIGRDFAEVLRVIWPEPFARDVEARFRQTLASGEPYVSPSTIEQRADTHAVEAYDWRIERITLPDGRHGVVCYFYDLSERNAYEAKLTQALADKDLLAREIDHRVKNSLTVVGSLLSMQRGATASAETKAALDEAAARVNAVARIHERLHKSHELGVIAFGDYLHEMCRDLARAMCGAAVDLACDAVAIDLPAETSMPLALIANELVTNAFKHGRAAGATRVAVTLGWDGGALVLQVADNGAGIPVAPAAMPASLGLKLVAALARQLGATATLPRPGAPARFAVAIPPDRLRATAGG